MKMVEKKYKSLEEWARYHIGCHACGRCQLETETGDFGSILAEYWICESWGYGYAGDSELDNRMCDRTMEDNFPFAVMPIECLIHKKFITKKKWKEQDDKHWEEMGRQIDEEIAKEQANEMVK